jgi:hypothetical protein
MSNFNLESVLNALNAPAVDPALLLDLDYNPAPMSLNEYAAKAVGSNDEQLELCRFHLEHGIYKDCGVTFEQFLAVVRAAS